MGFSSFINKPISFEELVEEIKSHHVLVDWLHCTAHGTSFYEERMLKEYCL